MRKGRFAIIPGRAVTDRALPRGALLVLCAVALHGDADGWCWPSQSLIADIAGISRQMVGRYLAQLEVEGYIKRRPRVREDGGRTSDEIRILYDTASDATLEVAPPEISVIAPPAIPEVAPPAIPEVALRNHKNRPNKQTNRTEGAPGWLPAEEWLAFLEMRKKLRAPMTDASTRRTLSELDKLRQDGHDPAEVLMQSVQHAWRGVFPLKAKKHLGNDEALREFNLRLDRAEGLKNA